MECLQRKSIKSLWEMYAMYSDIKSLEEEIRNFRAKMKESGKLCDLLEQVLQEITEYRMTLRKDFETVLNSLNSEYEHIKASNEKHESSLGAFLSEFEAKDKDFQSNIASIIERIEADYVNRDKDFQEKSDVLIKRIEDAYLNRDKDFQTKIDAFIQLLEEDYKNRDRAFQSNVDDFMKQMEVINKKRDNDFQAMADTFMKRMKSDYENRDRAFEIKTEVSMNRMESEYAECITRLSENERNFSESVHNSEKIIQEHYSKFEEKINEIAFDKFYESTERKLKSIEKKSSFTFITTVLLSIALVIIYVLK